VLIRVEECDGLKHAMKQGIYETNLMYLDQEKKMVGG
jgi:hypothetical protein